MTINTVQRTTHRVRGLLALAMISSFIFLVAESSSGVPAACGTGLRYQLHNNKTLDGTHNDTGISPEVEFNWRTGPANDTMPADQWSARWSGKIVAPTTGTYVLSVTADEGVRLVVDDQKVMDRWDNSPAVENSAEVVFEAGRPTSVVLEYYEDFGSAELALRWTAAIQRDDDKPSRW